jgi:hypothetical protein
LRTTALSGSSSRVGRPPVALAMPTDRRTRLDGGSVGAIEKRDYRRQHRADRVSFGISQRKMILVGNTLQVFFLGRLDCHGRHVGIPNLHTS